MEFVLYILLYLIVGIFIILLLVMLLALIYTFTRRNRSIRVYAAKTSAVELEQKLAGNVMEWEEEYTVEYVRKGIYKLLVGGDRRKRKVEYYINISEEENGSLVLVQYNRKMWTRPLDIGKIDAFIMQGLNVEFK